MYTPTERTINGVIRQGKSGTKWHQAVRVEESVEPGTMEYLRTGGWKTKYTIVVCEGQQSRGGHGYWGFIATDDTSRCTCTDCANYMINAQTA